MTINKGRNRDLVKMEKRTHFLPKSWLALPINELGSMGIICHIICELLYFIPPLVIQFFN